MSKQIKCGACGHTHPTVAEVFTCHNTAGVFKLQEADELAKDMPKRQNVKTPKAQEPKTYQVHVFPTKEGAEAFIAKTPKTRLGTTKVKYVDGKPEKTYQVIESLK